MAMEKRTIIFCLTFQANGAQHALRSGNLLLRVRVGRAVKLRQLLLQPSTSIATAGQTSTEKPSAANIKFTTVAKPPVKNPEGFRPSHPYGMRPLSCCHAAPKIITPPTARVPALFPTNTNSATTTAKTTIPKMLDSEECDCGSFVAI